MNKPKRIGVFGGTFDPVHNTHLAIARTALTEARLDLVLFVVSAQPPHKNEGPYASAEDRYDMVVAAAAEEQGFEVSRLELERPGPSYTADTLGLIGEAYPGAALFLIIGMDSLVDLPGWREPQNIIARADLLVVPRPGHWIPPAALKDRYTILPFEENDLASTEIRRRIAACEPIDHLVPLSVQQLIEARGIYDASVSDGPCR